MLRSGSTGAVANPWIPRRAVASHRIRKRVLADVLDIDTNDLALAFPAVGRL